jgi:uncharacterized membrane protein YbhN (UPF0104 family)
LDFWPEEPWVAWNKRWFKIGLQAAALLLVVWGIASSIRKSARQLSEQRARIQLEAEQMELQAEGLDESKERRELLLEAGQLRRSANDFWKARPDLLALAGACYMVGMFPAWQFWRHCLIALEQPSALMATMWAYFYGNLGKYFPGKAMVIVLRLAAMAHLGGKKAATTITIFMETLTMMSVGGAMAAVCLILLNLDWRFTALALGLLVATFIPTFPPLLRRMLPRLQPGVSKEVLAIWSQRIDAKLFRRGWFMLTLTWLAFGTSLMLVLHSLPSSDFSRAPWSTAVLSCQGACALAMVVGFVSLVPGGAGVREAVLSLVLTPVVGPVAALCGAVWLRVVWLSTELLVVAVLFLLKKYSAP